MFPSSPSVTLIYVVQLRESDTNFTVPSVYTVLFSVRVSALLTSAMVRSLQVLLGAATSSSQISHFITLHPGFWNRS
jgi:hypothetical protein